MPFAAFAKLNDARTFAGATIGFDSGFGDVGVEGAGPAAAVMEGDEGVSRGPPRWDA